MEDKNSVILTLCTVQTHTFTSQVCVLIFIDQVGNIFTYLMTFVKAKLAIFLHIFHLSNLTHKMAEPNQALGFSIFNQTSGRVHEFHFSSRHYTNSYINQVDEVHPRLVLAHSETPITPAGCYIQAQSCLAHRISCAILVQLYSFHQW